MKILRDIQSIANIAQLSGLLPYYKGDQIENLRIATAGKLYGRIVALIVVVLSIFFCEEVLVHSELYRLVHTQGDTEEINRTIETLFCICSYTVIMLSSVLNATKHFRTLRDLAKLDEYLESKDFTAEYKCKYIGSILFFTCINVVLVAFYYIHYQSDITPWRQFVLVGIYGLQIFYSCLFALYLRKLLMCLAQRMEFLNDRLNRFTLFEKQSYKQKTDWLELSNLIEVLCKFRYIIENINALMGVALLFIFGFAFYTVTNQSYLAFSTLTTLTQISKTYEAIGLSCAWVLAETLIVIVICSSFDCLASENSATLAMSPNSWIVEMSTHKSLPRRAPLMQNAFVRPATPPPPLTGESISKNPVFADISTILSVLKASGLLPIYEQVSSYEVGPPTKSNEFYSFFVRGVVHALTIFNIYSLLTPNSAQLFYSIRETDNVNQWIELLLCIITYTLTVFVCARNTKSILDIMNEILKLDEEVRRRFGVVLGNNCNFSIKFLLVIVSCQAYIMILKIYTVNGTITPTSYILIGFYAIQNGLTATYIVFAAALLRIVCIRFKFVNQLLNGYSYAQQQQQMMIKNPHQWINSMEKFPEDSLFIYRTHNKLLRIYKSINECCSLIIVCFLGYSFYTVTTNWYNLFVQITSTKGLISAHILQWCLAWLCLHTSLLALLSRSCGATTYEANNTSQILARVYGKSKEFQNIIDKFLTKSIKQEVQFTAYGFFAIDNSTLFKIFSAVTTYLVILIQFKQLEDSKLEEQVQNTS